MKWRDDIDRLWHALDRLWVAVVVNRDIGEIAVGHQDRLRFPAAQHPGLEMHRHRGLADPDKIGMHGNEIADIDGLAEIHRLDRNRHGARFGEFGREDAAADVHLAKQPATENIAILVGIGRHRQRANTEIAAGFGFANGRGVNGLVGHF